MADDETPDLPENPDPTTAKVDRAPGETDKVEIVDLNTEMQRSYIEYAMSVIVSRALPDVRDGMKPVHRRVLYAMYDGGYRPELRPLLALADGAAADAAGEGAEPAVDEAVEPVAPPAQVVQRVL